MADDRPRCTLSVPSTGPTSCYCTGRPGCRWRAAVPVCTDCGNRDCLGDCLDVTPRPIERVTVAGELL